jgi:hypothetical protein
MRGLLAIAAMLALGPAYARAETPAPDAPHAAQGAVSGEPGPKAGDEAVKSGASVPPELSAAEQKAYDDRRRAAYAAAEALQGPLDGGWTAETRQDSAPRYVFEFVDDGDVLEGAWRDRTRSGAGASGPVEIEARSASGVRFSFMDGPDKMRVVLRLSAKGWVGQVRRGGEAFDVRLVKISP